MSIANIVGVLMLVLAVAGLFMVIARDIGIKGAACVYGMSFASTAFIAISVVLVFS